MKPFHNHLRAVIRVVAFCAITAFFYLLWVCVVPLLLAELDRILGDEQ